MDDGLTTLILSRSGDYEVAGGHNCGDLVGNEWVADSYAARSSLRGQRTVVSDRR
jgi:hypothetical protein